MKTAEFKRITKNLITKFNNYSEGVFKSVETESKLSEAMKYSFFAGGKRIRPVLMMYTAKILNGNEDEILPFAFALECMHTYSLIHDDLPALDNDGFRRGKPTNHTVYGEATAILAGDALLNLAFEHVLKFAETNDKIKAVRELALSSGYSGMLEGQALDMESENSDVLGVKRLEKIVEYKTAKFIKVALSVPSVIYAPEKTELFKELGSYLGRLFQYADDLKDVISSSEIMGKTTGKDEKEDKLSAVKIFGLNGLKIEISSLGEKCKILAKSLDNSGFFESFTDYISN